MSEKRVRIVRVFLASPGDVSLERDRVESVINEINRSTAKEHYVRLECIRWESHVAPLMGRPQQVVLDQIELDAADVFIGILWHRFGTPTGGTGNDGREYLSGTEEEFQFAYQLWKTKGTPQILVYRCTRPPSDLISIDAEQFSRVTRFFKEFRQDGEHPGLVRTFQTTEELERRVREDLQYIIRHSALSAPVENPSRLTPALINQGFHHLFLPADNEERDDSKIESLSRAKDIRLVAHSGFSYLALVGHRFRGFVEERLQNGARFRVILTNPWSETGLFISLGEKDQIAGDSIITKILKTRSLEGIDPISTIEKSTWYSIKLRDAMKGYLRLKTKYDERIEARYWLYEMPASILLTDYDCYWEPYLNVNLQERLAREMLTFEVQVDTSSHIYRHMGDYFDFIWQLSLSEQEFHTNEEWLKHRLTKLFLSCGKPENKED